MNASSIHITAPAPGRFHLSAAQELPRPREEVFSFFQDARNLERLTPPHVAIRLLNPVGDMRQGARIEYELRLRGVPLRWTSEITVWNPPHRFVDDQRRGPYRFWIHQHIFEDLGSSTRVRDEVDYGVPGGRIAHAWFVRREVLKIFTYRMQALEGVWGG